MEVAVAKIPKLTINEIYPSVQGESTYAGQLCTFIRTTFCDLRCNYCDTEYAFYEGQKMELPDIIARVQKLDIPLVEVTGGEPLLQPNVIPLMRELCDLGFKVLIETSGAHDISKIDPRVCTIMDLKCPDSAMCERNMYSNIDHLKPIDEVKFVISSRKDYEWAKDQVAKYDLSNRVNCVLFSVVFGRLAPKDLVDWILEDRLPVRFQLQMHKVIWAPTERGV